MLLKRTQSNEWSLNKSYKKNPIFTVKVPAVDALYRQISLVSRFIWKRKLKKGLFRK